MPAKLYLSPDTDSAVHHALCQIHQEQRTTPLAPVYLLLPDAASIRYLRRRLADSVNVHLFEFYGLARHLLDRAGGPGSVLSDAALHRLLFHLLAGMDARDELSTFRMVWEQPGFLQATREWLREMKGQGISPVQVRETARTKQEQQLATLYERYEAFLKEAGYTDKEGLLGLADDVLTEQADLFLDRGSFFVLGFDQFNPVQLRLLRHLAARQDHFVLYLLWDHERPVDSPPLTRLSETRRQVAQTLDPEKVRLGAQEVASTTLLHFRRTLFDPSASPCRDDTTPPSIRAVAASSREDEVRYALRQVKRLLLHGTAAHDIAIVAPQPAPYYWAVQTVAEEYGVPVHCERNLATNPAVAALLDLLQLAPDHETPAGQRFPWRETFDVLRSPYFRVPWLSVETIHHLDRLTRDYPVVAGLEQWRLALRSTTTVVEDPVSGGTVHSSKTPGELEEGLFHFFDHVTPPPAASYQRYTLWLQEAILGLFHEEDLADHQAMLPSLHLLDAALSGPYAERDRAALEQVLDVLRSLVEATNLLPPPGDGQVSWKQYRAELLNILQRRPFSSVDWTGMVRFGPLEMGRAVVVDHLFVLGLSEGEFPRPPESDIFYTTAERERHTLPLQRIDPGEEASLWWQLCLNCRRSLTLLRPRIDDNGALWEPSPYWEAIVAQVEGLAERVELLPIGALPSRETAACPNELLLALAADGARRVPTPLQEPWRLAQLASRVSTVRQSRQAPGPFEGVLGAEDIRQELAQRYGPDSTWSPSRLNNYGNCPFGFFAKEILKLEPLPDPTEGWDVRQRGQLLHKVLENLFQCLHDEGLALTKGNLHQILQHLDRHCQALFVEAPAQYGFRPDALWEHEQRELRRMLRAMLIWECERNGEEPNFHPFQQEVRFGLSDTDLPPLKLHSRYGISFSVRGVIDRIDRSADGTVTIVDYKSGGTRYFKSHIEKGLSFQTTLYALAAESLLDDVGQVKASFCLHLPTRERGSSLTFKKPVTEDEFAQTVVDQAATFVQRAGEGYYPALPGKVASDGRGCSTKCDYASLCRFTYRNLLKTGTGGSS